MNYSDKHSWQKQRLVRRLLETSTINVLILSGIWNLYEQIRGLPFCLSFITISNGFRKGIEEQVIPVKRKGTNIAM